MDVKAIFSKREEIMKEKWGENKPFKLACLTSSSRRTRSSVKKEDAMLKMCIKTNSLLDKKYSNGETLLHIFARDNTPDVIDELLQKGYSIAEDDIGFYPWHTAAAYGSIEALESFIRHGCDVTSPSNHFQFSLLHIAVLGCGSTERQIEMIKFFAKNVTTIDIDIKDCYSRTPLFCAAQYGKFKLGEALLDLGANPLISSCFRQSALGIAIHGCPNLTMKLMDLALQKEIQDPTLSLMTQCDVETMYYCKIENRIMLHDYIKHIIREINSGKSCDMQMMVLLYYIIGLALLCFLCMTNEYEINTILKSENAFNVGQIFYKLAILWVSTLVIVDVAQVFYLLKSANVIKEIKAFQAIEGYQSNPYHQCLSADKTITIKRANNNYWVTLKHTIFNFIEIMVVLGAKTAIFALQFFPNDGNLRDYILSAAMIVIWWEMFRKLLWLTIIPDTLVIMGLTIQRCIFAIFEIILVALIISVPFILIFVKLSIIEGITIYRGEEDGNLYWKRILFTIGHMFRMLTLDNFHDYEFEDKHAVFLAFLYPIAMSIFSLVVLNMCIAKLSIEYKTITDNVQYEINRQRLYIKIAWDIETIKSKLLITTIKEKIKARLSQ